MAAETEPTTTKVRLTEAEARLDAAIALAQTGEATAAWAVAKAQIDAFPDEPIVLRKAGVVARLGGDHASALTLLKRALAPQLIEIADLHAGLGEKDEALRRYRQAIEAHPDYAAPYLAAAKLARDLGRSWDGFLLLERLFERLPRHAEGSALRAEFLRYHAAHPNVPRTPNPEALEGCDAEMVHFWHLRALTEIGDHRGVLAHAAQLTAPPGSDLAFHATVFAAHAKLALATDTAQSVARATALQRSPVWLGTERLAARLKDAIDNRRPLSMIRVGDGEARFLALGDEWARQLISRHEATCIVGVIWRNWFGQPIDSVDPDSLSALSDSFSHALADADIIGVSPAERYEKDTFHRGYLGLLERAVGVVLKARPEVSLTHAFANIFLHRRSPFYAELLAGLDFLGCISPHPGLAARLADFHGIASFHEYLVPGEARLPEAARGAGSHFPERFRELMTELRVPRPGAVFLVAAGLLGKIYCDRVRELGGIAIDVGSVVDAWMGFSTRPGLYNEPEKWVLPAGRTAAR